MKKHFWLPNAVATGLRILLFTLIALFLFSGCASKTDPELVHVSEEVRPGRTVMADQLGVLWKYTDKDGTVCIISPKGISCNFPEKSQNLTDAQFLMLTSDSIRSLPPTNLKVE